VAGGQSTTRPALANTDRVRFDAPMSAPSNHPVFAYGSNMDLDDLRRWSIERGYGPLEPLRTARADLPGWRLVWNYDSPTRRGGAANVEPAAGVVLAGAVLWVDPALLAAIDHKEGHPERYRRQTAPVRCAGQTITAWVYVVTAPWRVERHVAPRRSYVATVLRGGRRFGLPEAHLATIAAVPTLDD